MGSCRETVKEFEHGLSEWGYREVYDVKKTRELNLSGKVLVRIRDKAKTTTNKLLAKAGLRIVSSSWGPRGFFDAFQRLRKKGILPTQIVDVGASNGAWTRQCLKVFPKADYFLIDPLEENGESLRQLQRKQPRISVWNGALGAKAGRSNLLVHGDQSSFLRSEYSRNSKARAVEVRTLDSFLAQQAIKQPDLVKIDTQGFELEVLAGAAKCLEKCELLLDDVMIWSPVGVRMTMGVAHEVISFVGSRGFRIAEICSYVARPLDGELAYCDMLFAREDSALFKEEGWTKR